MRSRNVVLGALVLIVLSVTAAALPGLPAPLAPPPAEPEDAAPASSPSWSVSASPSALSGHAPFTGITNLTLKASSSVRVEIGPRSVPAGWSAQTFYHYIEVVGNGSASQFASFDVPADAAPGNYSVAFYASNESSGDNRTVTLNVTVLPPRPPEGLVLDLSPRSVLIEAGDPVTFELLCWTNGSVTADLSLGALPEGWTSSLSATSCAPAAGAPVKVWLNLTTPEDAEDQVVAVFADVRGSANDTAVRGFVDVNRTFTEELVDLASDFVVTFVEDLLPQPPAPTEPRIAVEVTPARHNASAGDTLQSIVRVHARSNATVTLGANGSNWTTTFTPAELAVAAGANATSELTIHVPSNATPGEHKLRFWARVQGTNETHEFAVVVHVAPPPAEDASAPAPASHEVSASVAVEASVSLRRIP